MLPSPWRTVISLAWRDLRGRGGASCSLWVFVISLALGVALIGATGGVYRLVSGTLLSDTRALLGGDLEVNARELLPEEVLDWMAEHGEVSRMTELRTMIGTTGGGFRVVTLQSVDDQYPLYGELELAPAAQLADVTGELDGAWGVAVDPVLESQLGIAPGDRVSIGTEEMEVRAFIQRQPDRSLRADWRGAPVLVSDDALAASGLIQPASRVEYEYRVRTALDPDDWRDNFYAAFPDAPWEIHTFSRRSERIAERMGQVASGILIIAFSTLFIGGLGVFNSVRAWLQGKLATIATLRALGLNNRAMAAMVLLQTGMLALPSCLLGAATGMTVAAGVAALGPADMALEPDNAGLFAAACVSVLFGLLVAYTFALPAVGRALSVQPAALFRRIDASQLFVSRGWMLATVTGGLLLILLVLRVLPDRMLGAAFIGGSVLLLVALHGVVRLLRRLGQGIQERGYTGGFALRLALAGLHRPGSALFTSLLSLGSALTLVVASTVVVVKLLEVIDDTIPEESPALVLYDISRDQLAPVEEILRGVPGATRVELTPLVLGRLQSVNGVNLQDSADRGRRNEARDEHKLTYRGDNIDRVTMDRGAWWPRPDTGNTADEAMVRVAMEDREADQLGLAVGDWLVFAIESRTLEAELTGIYRQKGVQTRFWFEGIFSDGALDPFIHRYVGAAWLPDTAALEAQEAIARVAPNVVSIRTADVLATASSLLDKAGQGLALIAGVSLGVSLLVLAGIMTGNRARHRYEAGVLNALGTRVSVIRRALHFEYLLLALVTTAFAGLVGSAIAAPLLLIRLKLDGGIPWVAGLGVALLLSTLSLAIGARALLGSLRVSPAALLGSRGD